MVMVNPDDLRHLGIAAGALVDIVGQGQDGSVRTVTNFRVIPYPTPPGCAAAYYPEVNALVPLDSTATGSNSPTSKSIIVRLTPPGLVSPSPPATSVKPTGADDHHKSPVEPFHLS